MITEARRSLGLFEFNATQQDDGAGVESRRSLQGLRAAEELAEAYPKTKVVKTCDRERDIWEMHLAAQGGKGVLLPRSRHGAQRRVIADEGSEDLWASLDRQPPFGWKSVEVRGCDGPRKRAIRKLRLEIRAARVDLAPPNGLPDRTPLALLAVSAREPNAPTNR